LKPGLDPDHVEDGNTLGNADYERNLGIDRLDDGVRRPGRRHIDNRGRGAGPFLASGHRGEDRQIDLLAADIAMPGLSALFRVDAADHPGAVIGQRLLRVEGACLAGQALDEDLGVLVNENGHAASAPVSVSVLGKVRQYGQGRKPGFGQCPACPAAGPGGPFAGRPRSVLRRMACRRHCNPFTMPVIDHWRPALHDRLQQATRPACWFMVGPQPFIAATMFLAASSRSSAGMTFRPLSRRIFLPNSTLVPSGRTTRGTLRPTSFTAATTPSAITSHFMMPPKMLTRMPLTAGSAVMILKAAVTFSFDAPPPTSRKFAGSAP